MGMYLKNATPDYLKSNIADYQGCVENNGKMCSERKLHINGY